MSREIGRRVMESREVPPRGVVPWVAASCAIVASWAACGAEPEAAVAAVRKASAAYADAYNRRDLAALAEQWTERAALVEGGSRFEGRDAILASTGDWLRRHPRARLAIEVESVELLAEPLARVRGVLSFTVDEGAAPVRSGFESLRVLDRGKWRLTESVVEASQAAALDDCGWLVGKWKAKAGGEGGGELEFERSLDGHLVLGRGTLRPTVGPAVEWMVVLFSDRGSGRLRAMAFDSTGATAEGIAESDGVALHTAFVGTPAEGRSGRAAAWVQVIAPAGERGLTLHSIERTIDGLPVADGVPLHYTRVP